MRGAETCLDRGHQSQCFTWRVEGSENAGICSGGAACGSIFSDHSLKKQRGLGLSLLLVLPFAGCVIWGKLGT